MAKESSDEKGKTVSATSAFVLMFKILFAGSVCMLAGTYLEIQALKTLGVFETLKEAGIFRSPFTAGAALLAFVPFAVVQTKIWWRWLTLIVLAIPFASYYAVAGTVSGLARVWFDWASGHAIMLAVFALIVAPVLMLHVRLFESIGVPEAGSDAVDDDDVIKPSQLRIFARVALPSAFIVLVLVDIMNASGLLSVIGELDGEMVLVATIPGMFAYAGAKPTSRRHWLIVWMVVINFMILAALLAITAALMVSLFWNQKYQFFGMMGSTILLLHALGHILNPVKRWFGPDGPWPTEDGATQ